MAIIAKKRGIGFLILCMVLIYVKFGISEVPLWNDHKTLKVIMYVYVDEVLWLQFW